MPFIEAPTTFYIGRRFDPENNHVIDDVVYYDSRDLTTHAVVVGMTGSGKTGLCITLLEEAIMDGIPAIIIDPKGDITNLMLNFPSLAPEEFMPWINEDDAQRAGLSPQEYAGDLAQRWREGLASWGIGPQRLQEFQRRSLLSIFTPGSDSGLPISIVDALQPPREGWFGHEEEHRERISGVVTALLALVGMKSTTKDREHVLVSNIIEYAWMHGQPLTIGDIIVQVQQPPFKTLGVFDINTFFPEKDRFKLAIELNNIIASPSFKTWLQGEPLDIRSLLYTPDGRPRVSIFYIAHLNDSQRSFIITLILENMLAWMRTLGGTSSLRAIMYFDEVFGHFPPYPKNPPTKDPLLRMLKQGRAFGIGTVLATQNPGDLDYKGLSNAGTWFLGRLQTENDKRRVLDGLATASSAEMALDLSEMDRLLTNISPRVFVMNNVHDNSGPIVMHTRWAMSYLRGPLTRTQVAQLMTQQKQMVAQGLHPSIAAAQMHYSHVAPPTHQFTQPGQAPQGQFTQLGQPAPHYGQGQTGQSGQMQGIPGAQNPQGATGFPPPPPPNLPESSPPPSLPEFDAPQFRAASHQMPPQAPPQAPPAVPGADRAFNAPPPIPGAPQSSGFAPLPGTGQQMPPTSGFAPLPGAPTGQQPPQTSGFAPLPGTGQQMPQGTGTITGASSPYASQDRNQGLPHGYSYTPPSIYSANSQFFLPMTIPFQQALAYAEQRYNQRLNIGDYVLLYQAVLIAQCDVRYMDRKMQVNTVEKYAYIVPNVERSGLVHWEEYRVAPIESRALSQTPVANSAYSELPLGLTDRKRMTALEREIVDYIYKTAGISLLANEDLKLYAQPGQPPSDFQSRVNALAREQRDAEIDQTTARFSKEFETIEERLRREEMELRADEASLQGLGRESMATMGEAALSLLRGRTTYTLSRVTRVRRYQEQARKDVLESQETMQKLAQQLDSLQGRFEAEINQINQKWAYIAANISQTRITPLKKDIHIEVFGIGWQPYYYIVANGRGEMLPAWQGQYSAPVMVQSPFPPQAPQAQPVYQQGYQQAPPGYQQGYQQMPPQPGYGYGQQPQQPQWGNQGPPPGYNPNTGQY